MAIEKAVEFVCELCGEPRVNLHYSLIYACAEHTTEAIQISKIFLDRNPNYKGWNGDTQKELNSIIAHFRRSIIKKREGGNNE